MKNIGLYLFTNDLRINDNPLLQHARNSVDKLICVVFEPKLSQFSARFAQEQHFGEHRQAFIAQSIADLEANLSALGQQLIVISNTPIESDNTEQRLAEIVCSQNITHFFAHSHCSYDERLLIDLFSKRHPALNILLAHHTTLFEKNDLPFGLTDLPRSFTQFRMRVEQLSIDVKTSAIECLSPVPATSTST
ncbi:deoxyribodipyrimidine photo-lyase [uncultured Vibrio sp.]|uniref:deoxyribodipyrimidine photo-lyase n=1 Tax=uncultured Vibrio sp. TaxID=114054 RepID=UPI0026118730|nr:deoxyribodipyrimidine photo-lyase [uncultured Vibrio sp.]